MALAVNMTWVQNPEPGESPQNDPALKLQC